MNKAPGTEDDHEFGGANGEGRGMIFSVIVCIVSGIAAGVGTGFAGLSAAAFIAPMLVTFLDVPIYDAVGTALFSDVIASALSARTYAREGNIDLIRGRNLLISVILFAVLGSVVAFVFTSTAVGNSVLGYWSVIGAAILGITLIRQKERRTIRDNFLTRNRAIFAVICGIYIGIVCGFQGTGGGLMLLFVLTIVMGFSYKPAVGTSVFIMTFTALIGGTTHFILNGLPDISMLLICVIVTAAAARISARIANKRSDTFLKLFIGWLLICSGIFMLIIKIFG